MTSLWRGSWQQRLRLLTGLILLAFAAAHFLNHALGLVSLDAMNTFDAWRVAAIRSLVGTIVLIAALAGHVVLSLMKVLRRRTLRMPVWEAVQISMGLLIPAFLLPHVMNTRMAHRFFGVQDTYAYELARLWPNGMLNQTVLMLLVWVHGCMGLHYWLRLSPRYQRVAPVLLGGAVLLPFAAFTGLAAQGRTIAANLAAPASLASFKAQAHWPDEATLAAIMTLNIRSESAFYSILIGMGAFAAGRFVLWRQGGRIVITYPGGITASAEPGLSLLEISRRHAIPHMAVCGGRGRCSTCRVAVIKGQETLEPPSSLEIATLAAIGAGPHVRLACQARPRASLTIVPLIKADRSTLSFAGPAMEERQTAVERDLAVLFVDMRGFTAMTERRLAFDVVFILNQFFSAVGKPIYDQGGWIANYIGDGLIALFADEAGIEGACRAALVAAAEIDTGVAALNKTLKRELQSPIQIAMGLHAGPHVIGHIGYKEVQSQTVIGLAVNIASRMEALAKSAGVQLALSGIVASHAALDTTGLRVESIEVRGLAQAIDVVFIDEARLIGSRLN